MPLPYRLIQGAGDGTPVGGWLAGPGAVLGACPCNDDRALEDARIPPLKGWF